MVDLEKLVRKAVAIWAAMVVFDFAFFGMTFFMKPDPKPLLPLTATTVAGIALAALVAAVLSVLMPARAARTVLRGVHLSFRAPLGAPEAERVIDKVDEVLPRLTFAFQKALQVGCATSLSVVLMGLALRALGLAPLAVTPFFIVSLALLARQYPTPAKFVALIERATDAKWPAT